jgi:hypothetical protein
MLVTYGLLINVYVLQKGASLYNSLHDKLNVGKEEEAKKFLVMARVSNMYCPANLDKKPSKLHVHPSNGVFVAVDDDVIYCSCSECQFEGDRETTAGSLKLVKGTEGQRYGWGVITKDLYSTLIASSSVTGKPCPDPCGRRCHTGACVCILA